MSNKNSVNSALESSDDLPIEVHVDYLRFSVKKSQKKLGFSLKRLSSA